MKSNLNKVSYLLVIIFIVLSCKNFKSNADDSVYIDDSAYVVDSTYTIGNVRRYGVIPGKPIGQHPKLLKDKLDILLEIAERGITITFPEGVYDRTLNIRNRNNISLISENALFTGPINIDQSNKIDIKGTIQTLTQFVTKESENLRFENIIIKSDTILSGNGNRSYGCSIHAGTKNLNINKLVVEDVGSGSEDYNFVKGGLVVHGHNNEPHAVSIDTVIIQSSDKHGAYLTGSEINIKYLQINKFGMGPLNHMAPMEGGIDGEQFNFAGLWIKNCFNSKIEKVVLDITESEGKYGYNFDIGESFRPFKIDELIIKGSSTNKSIKNKSLSRTGVILEHIIEN